MDRPVFHIVVITPPQFLPGEAEALAGLLGGLDCCRVHLRKPGSAELQMRGLVEALPEEFRPRITLQDHLCLAPEYGLGGVHPTSRFPDVPEGWSGFVSRSCHSLEELAACRDADYLFLSPVFDSISKKGYMSSFTDTQLRGAAGTLIDSHVYALGGVRPEHFFGLHSPGKAQSRDRGGSVGYGDFPDDILVPCARLLCDKVRQSGA